MHLRRLAGLVLTLVLGAAVPAFAQVMPLAGSSRPLGAPPVGAGPATGSGDAGASPMERQGPFVSVGLDTSAQGVFVGDLQLGWMIAPWVGVFVSLDGLVANDVGAHLRGAGLRLASGVAFAEARILSVGYFDRECDDDACGDAPRIALLGAGVELVRSQHVALDLHLHVLTDGRDSVPLVGLGLGFYY
jgi:hypothetical protein